MAAAAAPFADAIISKIDPVIERMEKSLEKIELYQNKKAKLPGAELDLLKGLEDARDLMHECMKKSANDRTQLEAVFGGDCLRIRRIRGSLECLDERPLSDFNQKDQRLKGAHDACDSVIKVLEDMGYGWLLRSRVVYGTSLGEPFKGNAFTVGTKIDDIKPKSADAFTSFKLDTSLPEGLMFDEGTGLISGTPTVETPMKEYVITCQGTGKPVECRLGITVLAKPIIPPKVKYAPSQQSFRKDLEIGAWLPVTESGDPADEFTILPALPAGLGFDKATGRITGKPSGFFELAPFTVTAKNKGGANHVKISLEVIPNHNGDLVARIIACTEPEQLTEFETDVVAEKNDRKPFNWMIWMVHRAHLNDPTLKKFDFTNMKMPSGLEEPLIAPKLAVAIGSNDQIEELLMSSSNLQNSSAAVLAVSLKTNNKLRVLNIDSNSLQPMALESLAHGIGENQCLQEFRCNNVASGRQVLEAIATMVKANQFIVKVGMEIKDPHFRGQIDGQITRNNDGARKRRVAAKKAAEAAAAEAAAEAAKSA